MLPNQPNSMTRSIAALCLLLAGFIAAPSRADHGGSTHIDVGLTAPATSSTGNYTITWNPYGTVVLQEKVASGVYGDIYTGPATSYAVAGRATDTYDYRIRKTICTWGCVNLYTLPETIVVSIPPAPPATTQLISLDGSYDVSWTNTAGVTSYKLEEQVGTGAWVQVYSGSGTSTTLSGRATGSYNYRVTECTGTSCTPPSAPTPMEVEIVSGLVAEPAIATATAYGDTPFSASVARTGDSSIVVPLRAPNGVNGHAPGLSLTYSSGASPALVELKKSEGVLGYGWRLSGTPEIRRCRVGIGGDIAYNLSDLLCLNGNALVQTAGTSYWADDAEYRTEIDTQVKIVAHGIGLANRYFEVFLPNGGSILFGDTADTRVNAPNKADPYLWSPRLQTDAFGNTISYDWKKIASIGTNFLQNIFYANAQITFEYAERCESLVNCDTQAVQSGENIPGVKSRAVVLNHITTYINSQPTDEYRLDSNYVDGYLRLEQLQHCARNNSGSAWDCMSPLSFRWLKLTINDTQSGPSDQLVVDQITNSFGDSTNFDYQVIDGSGTVNHALHTDANYYFGQDTSTIPDVAFSTRQRAMVEFIKRPDGQGGQTTRQYRYQGYPLYNTKGYGYVGFPSVYAEFYNQTIQNGTAASSFDAHQHVYKMYRLDFPFIGRLAYRVENVDAEPGPTINKTDTIFKMWNWAEAPAGGSSGSLTHFPYVVYAYEISKEVYENAVPRYGYAYGYASSTFTSLCWRDIDASGNCSTTGTVYEHPTQLTRTIETGTTGATAVATTGIWGTISGPNSPSGIINITEQTIDYSNIPSSWLVGFASHVKTAWGTAYPLTDSVEADIARDAATHNKPGVIQQFPGDPLYDTTTTLGYDLSGNVISTNQTGVDMPTISTSASSFLDNMYPTTLTNAKGQATSLGFDARFGTVNSVTDPNNNGSRTIARDPFGRITSSVDLDGTTTAKSYSSCATACGTVTWAVPRLKVTKTFVNGTTQVAPTEISYFDTNGRLLLTETEAFSATDGWVRVQRHYDAMGKLIKQSLPYFSVSGTSSFVDFFYDQKNRLTHISRPDGSAISQSIFTEAATFGQVTVDVTETGSSDTKRLRFNALGQLIDTTDAYGTVDAVVTVYAYTARGQLDTVQVDGVQVADMAYDLAGNRISIDEPDSGLTTFKYYSNSWLKQIDDANANKTVFTYDALGRVITRVDGSGSAGAVTNSWTWDTALNGIGFLARRDNGTEFSESYTYDLYSRLDTITASVNVSGFNDNGNYVVDYDFDTAGRLQKVTYPNAISFDNVFTAEGYLSQVKNGTTVVHEYTDVDAFGNIIGEKYGNGLQTAYGFDANTGRLTSIETGTAGTPKSVQDLEYTWKTNGTLLSRTNQQGTASTSDDITETFGFDFLNRLKSADTLPSGRTLTQSYDNHGNLFSKMSDIAGDLDVSNYSYPVSTDPHRLSSVNIGGISTSFSYDAAGNITLYDAITGDDTFIDYDKSSRVTRITLGSSALDATPTARDEFWYGPDGQRFLRKASWMDGSTLETSWTLYLLGGVFEEVHPEYDMTVNYRQRILVTSNVQYQYTKYPTSSATSIDYLHRDHLGSIVARSDASGNVISSVAFDPFGLHRGINWDRDQSAAEKTAREGDEDTFTARGFTDHEMLNRTGFVHMNGRVFDPRIGRFIQPDPIVGRPTNSQNYNRYAYAFNDPLSFTDPSGFDNCDTCIGGRSGGTGAVTTYGGAYDEVRYLGDNQVQFRSGALDSPFIDTTSPGISSFDQDPGIDSQTDQSRMSEVGPITNPFTNLALADVPIVSRLLRLADASVAPLVGLGRGLFTGDFTPFGLLTGLTPTAEESQTVGVILSTTGPIGMVRVSAVRGTAQIAASNSTQITGLTRHGINRAIGDGASRAGTRPQAILDALKSPRRIVEGIDSKGRPFQVFHGSDARVVINPQTGQIISTNPLSAGRAL